ncbi:hypothetical protein ACWGE1_16910 [Streptomyces sp. NPDC054932]
MELHSRLLLEDNILVATAHEPVGTEQRAALAGEIDRLIDEHRPAGLVAALGPAAATAAAVSVVLRLYRHHASNGIVIAVATPPAAVRYLIKANQPSLPVHTDTTDALRDSLRRQTACHHPRAAEPSPGVRQSTPASERRGGL